MPARCTATRLAGSASGLPRMSWLRRSWRRFAVVVSYELARADARPWLHGIAANVIGKHRRSELRMLRAFARAGVDPIADGESDRDGDGVDTRLAAGAVRAELAAALAALPRRDREVLLLVAWAELTYDEVAVALSIPVGTVRSRLNRARAGVRAALGPGFHDEGDHR